MRNMHRKTIAASPRIGTIAAAHNSAEDPVIGAEGLVKLKSRIEQNNFRKTQRPWFLQFNRQGKIT